MTVEQLLDEVEGLPHSKRIARMVELGRGAASGTPESSATATLLDALMTRGTYERRLAVYSCFGSRNHKFALAGIKDESRLVRGLAIYVSQFVLDDATLKPLLDGATRAVRLKIICGLLKRRRRPVIDAFLDGAIAGDEKSWIECLPYGSEAFVERHGERFVELASSGHWTRLARLHPNLAAKWLKRQADAADGMDARLRHQAVAVLPFLEKLAPDLTLGLIKSLVRWLPLTALPLRSLINLRSNEVAALALELGQIEHLQFAGVAGKLSAETLAAVAARCQGSLPHPQMWLRKIHRDERAALYVSHGIAWRDCDGAVPTLLLQQLPREIRHAEARRNLDLPALATRPLQRIPYAAFLPWDQMRGVVDPLLRHPDADTRAVALSTFIATTRFHRERLAEVMSLLLARRHEPDPVKLAIFTALAGLPPGRWQAEHLESLGQSIRYMLDATDTSTATSSHAERLVVGLVPFHAKWSAKWLAILASERGFLTCGLLSRLPASQVRALVSDLLPVLKSWNTREREMQIVNAARIFGRRLRDFGELVEILALLAKSSANAHIAESALAMIAAEVPNTAAQLIPELLTDDRTWSTRLVVYTFLHRRRQDLLAYCLGRKAYVGRFSNGKTRFFLPVNSDFHRWTPRQQATLALTLDEVACDTQRDVPAVLAVIQQRAALPDIPPTCLVALSELQNPRPAVRDAALRALGTLDAGQGASALLAALNDDRARVAIYALRAAIMEMPSARAIDILRSAPTAKVTVAKEVVRLFGEIASDESFAEILAWEKKELHRDVQAACLRALWSFLDRSESWDILHKAVASGDPGQADIVIRTPVENLNSQGRLRLARLLSEMLAHGDAVMRVATLKRIAQLPLNDPEHVLLSPMIAALSSRLPDESRSAASAVFATYAGREAQLVAGAVSQSLSNRQALWTLVNALCSSALHGGTYLTATARAVLAALLPDRLTVVLRARIAVLALPALEVPDFLEDLARRGQFHSDALAAATYLLTRRFRSEMPEVRELIRERLGCSSHSELRRLALSILVTACESWEGWTELNLARLQAFRLDPSPLVAEWAQFTFPPAVP